MIGGYTLLMFGKGFIVVISVLGRPILFDFSVTRSR